MPHVAAGPNPLTNGANLQSAIDTLSLGQTITLDPFNLNGYFYKGNFTLPNRGAGTSWMYIEPSSMASLPDENTRIEEAHAPFCARIESASNEAAFLVQNNAHHWHLRGLDLTAAADTSAGYLIRCIDSIYETCPHDLVYDRLLMHPRDTGVTTYFRNVSRAVEASGINVTVKNCNIYGITYYMMPRTGSPYNLWTITAATNASPCQVTLTGGHPDGNGTTNTFPGFFGYDADSNDRFIISFSGGTGNWAALNGTFVGTRINATTLTLETFDPITCARTPVNSTSFGSFSGQTILRLYQETHDALAVGCVAGPGPLTIHNNRLESYVYQVFFGGGATAHIKAQNVTTVESVTDIDTVKLVSLGEIHVGSIIAFATAQPQAITAASATNPAVLTVTPHRFPIGHPLGTSNSVAGLRITGMIGSWAAINAVGGSNPPVSGRVISPTQIEVWNASNTAQFNATGFTGFGGSPTYIPQSAAVGESWQCGIVTAVDAGTRVISYDFLGHPTNPAAGNNGAGVPVAVGSVVRHDGLNIDTVTVSRNTIGPRTEWLATLRDRANTMNLGVVHEANPKGCFECKNVINLTIEGNVMGAIGASLSPRGAYAIFGNNQVNQTGAWPFVSLDNHIYRNNLCLYSCEISTTHGDTAYSSKHSAGLRIENNLFTDTQGGLRWIFGSVLQDVVIQHNTVINDGPLGSYTIGLNGPQDNIVFRDNIACLSSYGYTDFTGGDWEWSWFDNNVVIDNLNLGHSLPPNDLAIVHNFTDMHFADKTTADAGADMGGPLTPTSSYHGYRLTSSSPGYHAAPGGVDVGVDFAALDVALGVATVGSPYTLSAGPGSYSVTGSAAGLVYSGTPPEGGVTIWGINCRATVDFINPTPPYDPAPFIAELGNTGWTPALAGGGDRDTGHTMDHRLQGIVYQANAGGSFVKDFTIPSAGTYLLRLALGDFLSLQEQQNIEISDTATPVLTLHLAGTPANSFYDATGVLRTGAAWPTDNVGVEVTFATTTLRIALAENAASVGYTTLAHVSLETVGGGGGAGPSAYYARMMMGA